MRATVMATNLNSAADYLAHVVKLKKDALFGAPSTFANALNLTTALYQFHEWLFDGYRAAPARRSCGQ